MKILKLNQDQRKAFITVAACVKVIFDIQKRVIEGVIIQKKLNVYSIFEMSKTSPPDSQEYHKKLIFSKSLTFDARAFVLNSA